MTPTGRLERVRAELSGANIALDMPGLFPQPVAYQTLTVAGDYLTGPRQFDITSFNVTAPGFALDASGTVTLNDKGAPGLVAKARIPAMPVRQLAALLAAAGGAGRAQLDRREYLRRRYRSARGAEQFCARHAGPGYFARRLADADLRHAAISKAIM